MQVFFDSYKYTGTDGNLSKGRRTGLLEGGLYTKTFFHTKSKEEEY